MKLSYIIVILIVFINHSKCHEKENQNFREKLKKWLEKMSVQKPVKCTVNPEYLKPFSPKVSETFMKKGTKRPLITIHECREGSASDLQIKGKIVNGTLEGPGKVKLVQKDASTLCGTRKWYMGLTPVEFVGNFKNGTLEGPGKISMENGVVYVANFINGFPVGLIRSFDKDGALKEVYYEDLRRKGYSMTVINKNRFAYARFNFEKFEEFDKPIDLIISLNETDEILAGNILLTPSTLENVHTVKSFEISNSDEYCMPEFKWIPDQKQDYIYLYSKKNKTIQISTNHENYCENNPVTGNLDHDFGNFSKYVYSQMDDFAGYAILYKLKHEESEPDPEKVKQPFITNLSVNVTDLNKVNMSIWNGPIQSWSIHQLSVDEDLKPHGECNFNLDPQFYNDTGFHNFLNWSPKMISGRFIHGVLQGTLTMYTWRGQLGYFTVKNGILHGPGVMYGIVPILDAEVMHEQFFHNDTRLSLLLSFHHARWRLVELFPCLTSNLQNI